VNNTLLFFVFCVNSLYERTYFFLRVFFYAEIFLTEVSQNRHAYSLRRRNGRNF